MVVVEERDGLMVGTGEDLQEGINRKQVKAGRGSSFFGKKKNLGGVTERKRRRVVHERTF